MLGFLLNLWYWICPPRNMKRSYDDFSSDPKLIIEDDFSSNDRFLSEDVQSIDSDVLVF